MMREWRRLLTVLIAPLAVFGCDSSREATSTFALIAKRDLPATESLTFDNIEVVSCPAYKLPKGAISSLATLQHALSMRPLSKGEILTESDIFDRSGLISQPLNRIKRGHRVISFRVLADPRMPTLRRGEKVDVWAMPELGRGPKAEPHPMLRSVSVLDDGTHQQPYTYVYSGVPMNVRNVSLEVTLEDAQRIGEYPRIPLFLRHAPTYAFLTKRDVKLGEQLTFKNVDIAAWTDETLPEGAISTLEMLHHMVAKIPLPQGHILSDADISEVHDNAIERK